MCDRSLRVCQTVRPLMDEYNVKLSLVNYDQIEFSNLLRELNGGDYARMTYD